MSSVTPIRRLVRLSEIMSTTILSDHTAISNWILITDKFVECLQYLWILIFKLFDIFHSHYQTKGILKMPTLWITGRHRSALRELFRPMLLEFSILISECIDTRQSLFRVCIHSMTYTVMLKYNLLKNGELTKNISCI